MNCSIRSHRSDKALNMSLSRMFQAERIGCALGLGFFLLAAALPPTSSAQYVPPRVELEPAVSANKYPHLEADDVVMSDCIGINRTDGTIRSEEIGTIQIMAYTPWYQTAEHLAKEKAGEAGANCLMSQFPPGLGPIPVSYPFTIAYRAFRLTRQKGFGSTSYWIPIRADAAPSFVPASTGGSNPPPGASAPQARPAPAPTGHAHLWTSGNFIYRYEIGMDTAKFSKETWEDVALDFKEYFPSSEYQQLLLARRGKEKVVVDFKNMRIRRDL
ncbi:MAG: hypothetical protein M0D55_06860 [Elusimicrobiota bacterium]|nr:MAG: hypothetical protein M0D55_06860 [Elusimicrobiota bacterium]